METNKKPSPFAVLWGWAERYHGGFYSSVALAVLRVACQMATYFCIAVIIRLRLEGSGLTVCLPLCGGMLCAYKAVCPPGPPPSPMRLLITTL